jgi:16S rRNA (guanine527-N7)-methyltransferase
VTRASFAEILKDRTSVAGLTVAEDLVEPLFAYYELLSFWNRKINLTAVNLEELTPEGVDRLFVEPLSASRFAEAGINVIDIGSGGGSPAIPFSLAVHATSLTMIESRTRKSVFLQEAARATGLRTEVVTAR